MIDGEQVGPISDADVRTKIDRGEVKADTYTWKEGFADWVKLSSVPEFAGLVTEEVPVVPVGGGDLFTAGAGRPPAQRRRSGAPRQSGAGQSLFAAAKVAARRRVRGASGPRGPQRRPVRAAAAAPARAVALAVRRRGVARP